MFQEFKCLRYALKHLQIGDNQNMNVSTSKASSPDCSSTISQDGSSNAGGYFSRFAENGSPFDIIVDEVQDDDILSNFEVRTTLICQFCLVKKNFYE